MYDICEAGGLGSTHQLRHCHRTSVDVCACREQESDLLGEGVEFARGRARGGDEDSGILDPGEGLVLVVQQRKIVVGRLIVGVVLAQFLVVGNVGGQWLARSQGLSQLGSSLRRSAFLESQGSPVKVIPSLPGLSSYLFAI